VPIDTDAAKTAAEGAPGAIEAMVASMTMDLAVDVGPQVLDAGIAIWEGMAAIVIAWHGMKIALGARTSAAEIMQTVMMLMIPRAMLWLYGTPLPGVDLNMPQIIVSQGAWLTQAISEDASSILMGRITEITDTFLRIWSFPGGVGFFDVVDAIMSVLAIIPTAGATVVLVVGLVILAFLSMAQVIWAGFGIAVVSIFGPLFIPWLAFQPLSFLFWNWFRTLLTLSLYAPLAAAVMRVFAVGAAEYVHWTLKSNLIGATATASTAAVPTAWKIAQLSLYGKLILIVIAGLPIIVGIIAVLRIPALAAGLTGGANFGGMGEVIAAGASVATSFIMQRAAVGGAMPRLRRAVGGGQ
jgi:hypothetical protein